MMIDVDDCRRGLPMMEMKDKDGRGVGIVDCRSWTLSRSWKTKRVS